jgi:Matrixin
MGNGMRVTALLASLIGLATLVAAGEAGAQPPEVGAPEAYPVIPDPEFEVPVGGRRALRELGSGESEITLLRANGVQFARRLRDRLGRPVETEFFDENGATKLTIYADYGEGPNSASTSHLASNRQPSIVSLNPPLGDIPDRSPQTGIEGLVSHITCGSDYWLGTSSEWNETMTWRWSPNSLPPGISVSTTLARLRDGRIEWENNINHCSYADFSSINFTYLGTTTLGYGNNGVNTVGWGNMAGTACGAGAAACTRVETCCVNSIVEADVRFKDQTGLWINGAASGKLDIQSAFAHETGHCIGFRHIDYSADLVMYPIFHFNDASGRKLGQGDAIGNNAKY